jgi:hypothetical protein
MGEDSIRSNFYYRPGLTKKGYIRHLISALPML